MSDITQEELRQAFDENCPLQKDDQAAAYLEALYERNLKHLFASRVTWAGRERDFAIRCAADLGREAHAKAIQSGEILLAEHVHAAALALIPGWEKVCPLPSSTHPARPGGEAMTEEESPETVTKMDSGCTALRPFLSLPPAAAMG